MAASRALFLLCLITLVLGAGTVLAQDTTLTPGDLVARGREHAAADRHGAATADFLEAVSRDRTLLPVIARDIAYQTLWREDASTAVRYFRTWLSLNPNSDDREVRTGLALALSWSGQQGEAVNMYRQLAEENPADGAPRVGLGRTLLWDNRLREGYAELRQVEKEFSYDSAAYQEAGRFLLTVFNDYDTPLGLRYDISSDSDNLEIARLGAWTTHHVGHSFLATLSPSRATYRQDLRPDVDAYRLRGGLVGAITSDVSIHLYGWLDSFEGSGPDTWLGEGQLDWNVIGTDGWVTWLPHNRLRFDLGAGRQPLEAMTPLARHIVLSHRSLSSDWRLSRWWTASGSIAQADYSDGNQRWSWNGRLQWRREGRWEIWAGPTAALLDFSRPGDGYWSPDRMANLSFETRLRTRGRRWIAEFSGKLGAEKETGAETISVGSAVVHFGYRVTPAAMLTFDAGHSRSRVTGSGYSRDFGSVALRLFY